MASGGFHRKKARKALNCALCGLFKVVARTGIEPVTQGFSVLRSTI